MDQEFWHNSTDGVVYAEPKGFLEGYYIYPPKYDEESPKDKYQLYLIEESGNFNRDNTLYFDTLEQAKKYVTDHFKSLIEPFLCLFKT